VLDRLEGADRACELVTLQRILAAVLEGGRGHADGFAGEQQPTEEQGLLNRRIRLAAWEQDRRLRVLQIHPSETPRVVDRRLKSDGRLLDGAQQGC
jgi:hypothetical protein